MKVNKEDSFMELIWIRYVLKLKHLIAFADKTC